MELGLNCRSKLLQTCDPTTCWQTTRQPAKIKKFY